MSKPLSKVLSFILVIAILIGGYFGLRYIYKKHIPALKQIQEKISIPGPLSGPRRPTRAETLSPEEIIKWTNYYREQEALSPLSQNNLLENAADKKAADMFKRQYFAHSSPTGDYNASELVKAEGYNYKTVGENLALGDFKDEKELVDAWMASPGHRANILNPDFKEIGVSAKLGQFENRTTWISVQIFATKAPQCTLPSASLKQQIEQKQALYDQITLLYQEGSALIQQGNAKIQEGNQIYQETHDASQAQPYWTEGENLQKQGQEKTSQAKALESQVQDLKSLIYQYNRQVNTYNQCINQ
jgi:uncharacterized protein YkwD